jgi:hypothetical protein
MGSTPSQSCVQESNQATAQIAQAASSSQDSILWKPEPGVAGGFPAVVCGSKRRIRGENSMFPCQHQDNSYEKYRKPLTTLRSARNIPHAPASAFPLKSFSDRPPIRSRNSVMRSSRCRNKTAMETATPRT